MKTYRGVVEGGGKRASALGYPTANIPLGESDASGIFAAMTTIGSVAFPSVAYADSGRGVLEVHIIDYTGDLYGRELQVVLFRKLRDAAPFASDEEARQMIAKDVADARACFTAPL